MTRFKTLLLAITLFIGGTTLATAQAKVAHVDTKGILETFPEFIAAKAQAKSQAESMTKTAEVQYNDMVKAFETKALQYQKEASTQTEATNGTRSKEIEKMRNSISEFQQQSQYNIEKAGFDKMQPVQLKVMAAIEKVAGTLGFAYVLDRAALVVAKGTDITAEVKKELGY